MGLSHLRGLAVVGVVVVVVAECYGVFGPLIEDNMKRLHGDSVHRGKIYKKYSGLSDENNETDTLPVMQDENDDYESRIRCNKSCCVILLFKIRTCAKSNGG